MERAPADYLTLEIRDCFRTLTLSGHFVCWRFLLNPAPLVQAAINEFANRRFEWKRAAPGFAPPLLPAVTIASSGISMVDSIIAILTLPAEATEYCQSNRNHKSSMGKVKLLGMVVNGRSGPEG